MDVYLIGFLLGVFMGGLSAVAFWMILGLAISVIRTLHKQNNWMMIVAYTIEAVVPLIVVIALGWLAGRISFDATAYWLGISLTIAVNGFIFLTAFNKMWNALQSELAGGKVDHNQQTG